MVAELLRGLGTLKSLSRVNAEPTATSACRICGTLTALARACSFLIAISGGTWGAPAYLNPSLGNEEVPGSVQGPESRQGGAWLLPSEIVGDAQGERRPWLKGGSGQSRLELAGQLGGP